MSLINWDNTLSVNVAEIDGQHHKLVEMINELHDAMRQGKSRENGCPTTTSGMTYDSHMPLQVPAQPLGVKNPLDRDLVGRPPHPALHVPAQVKDVLEGVYHDAA